MAVAVHQKLQQARFRFGAIAVSVKYRDKNRDRNNKINF